MSIGELAARSGLSPKALRLYAESGLLVPRRVDPFTGYRSYGTDQVERARLIASLRGIGMGLARIQVLCDLEGAAAAAELRSWWRQEEADAFSRAEAVRSLARDLGELLSEDIMTASTTRPRTASALHIGLERSAQQDAVLVRELPGGRTLLAVADGFGAADDLAPQLLERLERELAADPSADPIAALEAAWQEIESLVPAEGDGGSTLTAALLDGARLHIAHLGDTRVVLVRSGRIEHVTQDHTLLRSLVEAGRLSPEEVAAHP
ncbi:MAG TPA: MerR family transcriptional regulator, partial [Brachybacterium massiliense]|nr:MerR family transcriptional regulator [Brachybacterium massiliense]